MHRGGVVEIYTKIKNRTVASLKAIVKQLSKYIYVVYVVLDWISIYYYQSDKKTCIYVLWSCSSVKEVKNIIIISNTCLAELIFFKYIYFISHWDSFKE